MSHSEAFNIIFFAFFIIGLLGACLSFYLQVVPLNTIKDSNDSSNQVMMDSSNRFYDIGN